MGSVLPLEILFKSLLTAEEMGMPCDGGGEVESVLFGMSIV